MLGFEEGHRVFAVALFAPTRHSIIFECVTSRHSTWEATHVYLISWVLSIGCLHLLTLVSPRLAPPGLLASFRAATAGLFLFFNFPGPLLGLLVYGVTAGAPRFGLLVKTAPVPRTPLEGPFVCRPIQDGVSLVPLSPFNRWLESPA